MPQKNKHAHTPSGTPDAARLLRSALFGFLCALLSLPISIAVGAALCMLADDPNRLVAPTALFCTNLSALLGGWFGARKAGGAPLAVGLLGGGAWLLFSYLLALIFRASERSFSPSVGLLLRLLCLLFFTLGALLGAHRKKNRHRRRQKR